MRLIIISGRSGSGKSTCLRALEDEGYNAIDNFPVTLLQSLVHTTLRDPVQVQTNMAVCIDARSQELERFPEILLTLDRMDLDCQVIYLDARSPTLVKRFSETRRRHPLTDEATDLTQAIEAEKEVLESISDLADLTIDTTQLDAQDLVEIVQTRLLPDPQTGISLLFRSFGFKYGVPVDADFVFDIRCLPNPHWIPELKPLTGKDEPVIVYFRSEPKVDDMFADISRFLQQWIPRFEENNRIYMTVAIGCTGGKHRSVYMAEKLADHFQATLASRNVQVRHRELARYQ